MVQIFASNALSLSEPLSCLDMKLKLNIQNKMYNTLNNNQYVGLAKKVQLSIMVYSVSHGRYWEKGLTFKISMFLKYTQTIPHLCLKQWIEAQTVVCGDSALLTREATSCAQLQRNLCWKTFIRFSTLVNCCTVAICDWMNGHTYNDRKIWYRITSWPARAWDILRHFRVCTDESDTLH